MQGKVLLTLSLSSHWLKHAAAGNDDDDDAASVRSTSRLPTPSPQTQTLP